MLKLGKYQGVEGHKFLAGTNDDATIWLKNWSNRQKITVIISKL